MKTVIFKFQKLHCKYLLIFLIIGLVPLNSKAQTCPDAELDVALVADYAFFRLNGSNEAATIASMNAIFGAASGVFSGTHGINIGFNVLDEIVLMAPDDLVGNDNVLFTSLNQLVDTEEPCKDFDLIIMITGKRFGLGTSRGGGLSLVRGQICYRNSADFVPIAWVKAFDTDANDGNVATLAHEIGHILGALHTENTSCASECSTPPDVCFPGLNNVPLMCTTRFPGTCALSSCSRNQIIQTIDGGCGNCLAPNPFTGCENCETTIEIFAKEYYPVANCGNLGENEFMVRVCNDCSNPNPRTMNIRVVLDAGTFEIDPSKNLQFNIIQSGPDYLLENSTLYSPEECKDFIIITDLTATPALQEAASAEVRIPGSATPEDTDAAIIRPVGGEDIVPTGTTANLSDLINAPNPLVLDPVQACLNNSQNLAINGTLVIDQDYCFGSDASGNPSFLVMGPNAVIVVEDGATLNLNGTQIFACTDMWNALVVEPGGTVNVENAYIADAQISAIYAYDGARIRVQGTHFFNNKRALYIPFGGVEGLVADGFVNNRIESDGELKAPLTGQTANGLYIQNQAFAFIGYSGAGNIFKGLETAMEVWESSVRIENNHFMDISRRGVWAFNNPGNELYVLRNMIDNVPRAVFNYYGRGVIEENTITNTTFGVVMSRCTPAEHSISRNTIKAGKRGIRLINSNGGLDAYVKDNYVSVSQQLAQGISLSNYSLSPSIWNIEENSVIIETSGQGILISGGIGARVISNGISMKGPVGFQGVYLGGGFGHNVSCNGIGGENLTGGTGILSQSSSGSTIACNNTDNLKLGINFWGVCDGTDMRGNDINNHNDGLLLGYLPANDGNAYIGKQEHLGNKYWGSFASSYGATHLAITQDIIDRSPFEVDEIENPVFNTFTSSAFLWFNVENLPELSFYCETENTCIEGTPPPPIITDEIDILDESIAVDSLPTEGFKNALQWTAARHLYQRIAESTYTITNPKLLSFVSNKEQTTVGQYHDVAMEIGSLLDIDQTTQQSFNTHRDEITILIENILDLQANYDTTTNETQRTALMQQIESEFQSLLSEAVAIHTIGTQVKVDKEADILAIGSSNTGLGGTAIYESNEKLCNSLVLSAFDLQTDTLSPGQSSSLYSIANQCPLAGGDVVYWARGLLVAMGEDLVFDDGTLCGGATEKNTQSPTMKDQLEVGQLDDSSIDNTDRFELYPNPVQESFTLKYTIQQPSRLQLVDLLGRIVHEQELTDLFGQLQVTTNELSGVYFVNIVNRRGKSIYRHRITIIK